MVWPNQRRKLRKVNLRNKRKQVVSLINRINVVTPCSGGPLHTYVIYTVFSKSIKNSVSLKLISHTWWILISKTQNKRQYLKDNHYQ